MGKRCQVRSGDQRCTPFAGRPQLWCRLRLLRTMLQRTQHFVGGLKIPTWARLRRAATSRPAAFDFSQVKNRPGAWTGSSKKFLPYSPPSCCSLAPSVGAGRSSASSGRPFGFASRSINSATYFPLPAFKSVSGKSRSASRSLNVSPDEQDAVDNVAVSLATIKPEYHTSVSQR